MSRLGILLRKWLQSKPSPEQKLERIEDFCNWVLRQKGKSVVSIAQQSIALAILNLIHPPKKD